MDKKIKMNYWVGKPTYIGHFPIDNKDWIDWKKMSEEIDEEIKKHNKKEEECDTCKRMKDLGKKCWWCGC
jgi:hypothetical protein